MKIVAPGANPLLRLLKSREQADRSQQSTFIPFFDIVQFITLEINLRWKDTSRPPISKKSIFCLQPRCFLSTFRAFRSKVARKSAARSAQTSYRCPPKPRPKCSFRNSLDRYPTSSSAMFALLPELEEIISRETIGCFADICWASTDCVTVLMQQHFLTDSAVIFSNDIDPSLNALSHLDAADPYFPTSFVEAHPDRRVDVIVTSPPYSLACQILRNALFMASKVVAMKLPLQFLEPRHDHVPFLCPASGLRHVILMSREAAGGADGRSTAYSTEAWLVWDTSRRGTAISPHCEPSPKLSFAMAGTPICHLQTPATTSFTYNPTSDSDPSHITRTSPSSCAALFSVIQDHLVSGSLVATFADSEIDSLFLQSGCVVTHVESPVSVAALPPLSVDWLCCAAPRRSVSALFKLASDACRIGFCFRIHLFALEPNSRRAAMRKVVVLSRVVVRGLPADTCETFPSSTNLYTEMWLVFVKSGSGCSIYFSH